MHLFLALLMAAAFWEAKIPGDWTKAEIQSMFRLSPWVQRTEILDPFGGEPEVYAYLATAEPMRDAEVEMMRRASRTADELAVEYQTWIRENAGKVIVLAVEMPKSDALQDGEEMGHMERESFLVVGRKKHKLLRYFTPSSTDPRLRYVFPRVMEPSAKFLRFEIYVPTVRGPSRTLEFKMKDLSYKGQPSM